MLSYDGVRVAMMAHADVLYPTSPHVTAPSPRPPHPLQVIYRKPDTSRPSDGGPATGVVDAAFAESTSGIYQV